MSKQTMAVSKPPFITGLIAAFFFFLGWLLLASDDAVMQVSLWLDAPSIADMQPYLSYSFIAFGVIIFFIHLLRR